MSIALEIVKVNYIKSIFKSKNFMYKALVQIADVILVISSLVILYFVNEVYGLTTVVFAAILICLVFSGWAAIRCIVDNTEQSMLYNKEILKELKKRDLSGTEEEIEL